MRETYQLRVVEEFAPLLFGAHEGRSLGWIRLVDLPATDPRVAEVARLQTELIRRQGRQFFYGWDVRRHYTRRELHEAELFWLQVTSAFEPTGEECNTTYDESAACRICGAGAFQLSDLRLNLSKIPRGRAVSRTIAGEIVIMKSLAESLTQAGVPRAHFRPVIEHRDGRVSSAWLQLLVPESSIDVASATTFGARLFGTDEESSEYRCPLGHRPGLSVLSEVRVAGGSYSGDHVATSTQFVGVRRGLLRPQRLLFISPIVRKILEQEKTRGLRIEVAHLV